MYQGSLLDDRNIRKLAGYATLILKWLKNFDGASSASPESPFAK
jgi:hypothetical protein